MVLAVQAVPVLAAARVSPGTAPGGHGAPQTRRFAYSAYEQATLAEALASLGLTLDPSPDGKTVESIDTVRLEVIERRDPAPRWLNVFHVLTRAYVVEREVLLRPGEAYRQTLADETRRNLASSPQLSLVLVVAARGSAPDRVRVVVVTKDVWSLRLNWDLAFSSHGLEGLTAEPAETNFLGTWQTVGLLFHWLPESYSLGAQYGVPRVLGTHVTGAADAGLIVNARTGAREGSFGSFQLGLPLWSTRTRWSWGAGVSWLDEVTRLYSNGELARFTLGPQSACAGASTACVPYAYSTEEADAAAFVTRSFGWAIKQDASIGFEGSRNHYALPDLSGYDPATVEAFRATRVPVTDDRVGPYVQYRTYSTSYVRVLDLETLALQEDYRVGHDGYLRVYPVLRSLGSSRDFLGLSAGAGYTVALGDGLARVGLESVTEIETGSGRVADGSVRASLRLASPRSRIGRVVLDAVLLDRYANSLNRLSSLGGDSRLRGYPSQYLVGADVVAANLEYRSRPWQLFESVQVGGAAFWDVGDAFDGWSGLYLHQAVGAGARVLFPQLDRVVFRIDVGFPVGQVPYGVAPVAFFVTFGQAFSLHQIQPATAVTR